MAGADEDTIDIETDALEESVWSVVRLNTEIETVLTEADDRFPTYVYGEISEVNPYHFRTFFQPCDLEDEAVISYIA